MAQVGCVNRNVAPYLGATFWLDAKGMAVLNGGSLLFNEVSRSQAGQYICHVRLDDPTVTVQVPTLPFTLVVHCKLVQCTPDNWTTSVPIKSGPFIQMANISDFYANCLQCTILHMIHVHTCIYNN